MNPRKKFAVLLAACGDYDGAYINDPSLTLEATDSHGIYYQCFTPDINQTHVINHLIGEEMKETKNVLVHLPG